MGLPTFPTDPGTMTRDNAVNQILSSIAMEELGLSHIINAEGEKIQYVLGTLAGGAKPATPPTIDEVLKVNESVQKMLESASTAQMFLKGKMNDALNAIKSSGNTGGGTSGPAVATTFNADDAPKYVVGQLVLYNGQVYAVTKAPPTGTPDTSPDYSLLSNVPGNTGTTTPGDTSDGSGSTSSVGNGADGDTTDPGTGTGGGTTNTGPTTINFSSGITPIALAVAPAGAAGLASYIGNGVAGPGVDVLGNSFTMPIIGDTFSTTVAKSGTLDSVSTNFTTDLGASLSLSPVTVKAQMYYAAPGSDTFNPISSSAISMSPQASTLNLGTQMSGSANNINFPVAQGGRLMLAYNTVGGLLTVGGGLLGTGSGAATIK